MLWEMLAGHPPYAELDAVPATVAMLTKGVPSIDDHSRYPLPPALVAIVNRSTARSRDDRFPTAAELS